MLIKDVIQTSKCVWVIYIAKIVPDPMRRCVHTAGMSWTAEHGDMFVIQQQMPTL